MTPKSNFDLDRAVTHWLSGHSHAISRRSFFHAGTRLLMKAAGVMMAAQVLPYSTVRAQVPCAGGAGGTGDLCGQHGHTCKKTTGCGDVGTFWKQCCKSAVPAGTSACPVYKKCEYTDYCTNITGSNLQNMYNDCRGPMEGGGSANEYAWCGSYSTYICTVASCSGAYATLTDCANA